MSTPNPVPVLPAPVTTGAIPWYKSAQEITNVTTALSAAIAIFPKIGQWLGITNLSDTGVLVTNAFGVAAFVVPLIGARVRWTSKVQPLTGTASGAADHPATVAVKQVQAEMAQAGIDTAVVRQAKNEAATTVAVDAAAAAAAAPASPPPVLPVTIRLSPEDRKLLISELVVEIAHQQALYRANHPPVVSSPEPPK